MAQTLSQRAVLPLFWTCLLKNSPWCPGRNRGEHPNCAHRGRTWDMGDQASPGHRAPASLPASGLAFFLRAKPTPTTPAVSNLAGSPCSLTDVRNPAPAAPAFVPQLAAARLGLRPHNLRSRLPVHCTAFHFLCGLASGVVGLSPDAGAPRGFPPYPHPRGAQFGTACGL